MRIVSKSVRFLARMGFKISKKFLPHKIKRYIISLTLEYIKKRYSALFYKDFVAAISHGHYPSFLSDMISNNPNPQALEIFYENLFQIINGRIKQSKEEALAFAAHVIQILTSTKSLNDIESDYTENATLMGVKLSTIESLLPKGLGLYNIKVCLTNFGDYRFNKFQKLNFLIHNLLFLQNLKVKDPMTSLPTTLLKAKTITFHRAEIGGGGVYHFNLTCDKQFFYEGLISIDCCFINNNTSEFIYRLTFCITHNYSLLICCIQSKKDLEPMHFDFLAKYCKAKISFFLVGLAKELAKLLGCFKTLGIPSEGSSINGKIRAGEDCFNYDNFFTQCEAELIEIEKSTYWEIPLYEKPIEEYPHKHRTKKRARRKVLETFRQDLEKILVLD
ncbi:DUF535 family protein [Helicobacter pylori]|uniref:DUF535 family protein n=1 Tax=Helicobacter pylori TaxID=210 RepID=UPI001F1C8620|nr:DUF535 family protein [Helicobacter pylori]